MGLFPPRKPNIHSLDLDGLIEAAGYRDLLPDRDGQTLDVGIPVREEAVRALARVEADAAAEAIERALEDPSDRVRGAAVVALFRRGDGDGLAHALGRLPGEPGRARELAARALLELRPSGSAPAVAAAVVQRDDEEPLSDADAELVLALVETVEAENEELDGRRESEAEVVDVLIAALADERDEVAERAEDLLVQLAPAGNDALAAELARGAAPRRAAAALGRVGDSRAVDPLVAALDHPDPGVRAESCAALAELRDPAAVEPLLRSTQDGEHLVRSQAGWALDRMGTVAVVVGVSAVVRPMIGEAVEAGGGSSALGRGERPLLHAAGRHEPQLGQPPVLRRLARLIDRLEDVRSGASRAA